MRWWKGLQVKPACRSGSAMTGIAGQARNDWRGSACGSSPQRRSIASCRRKPVADRVRNDRGRGRNNYRFVCNGRRFVAGCKPTSQLQVRIRSQSHSGDVRSLLAGSGLPQLPRSCSCLNRTNLRITVEVADSDRSPKLLLEKPTQLFSAVGPRARAAFDKPGVYILTYGENGVPVYVGQGKSIADRLNQHLGSLVTGSFCYWDPKEVNRVGAVGLAKEVGYLDSLEMYIPSTRGQFDIDKAIEFARNLYVWPIAVDESATALEGTLIRAIAGRTRGDVASFMLANGDRSSSRPFVGCLDCNSLNPRFLREIAEYLPVDLTIINK